MNFQDKEFEKMYLSIINEDTETCVNCGASAEEVGGLNPDGLCTVCAGEEEDIEECNDNEVVTEDDDEAEDEEDGDESGVTTEEDEEENSKDKEEDTESEDEDMEADDADEDETEAESQLVSFSTNDPSIIDAFNNVMSGEFKFVVVPGDFDITEIKDAIALDAAAFENFSVDKINAEDESDDADVDADAEEDTETKPTDEE